MTVEKTDQMKVVSSVPKRSCHICGRPCDGWCPTCLIRYAGRNRVPASAMTPEQKTQEVQLLLTPPYEIPAFVIYNRICELLGQDIGLSAFCMMERKRESEQPHPLFRVAAPERPPAPPAGQMPGVSVRLAPPAPAAADKERSAVPTLKSFAQRPPSDPAVPTYVPPQQAFPICPAAPQQAVSLRRPPAKPNK